MSDEDVVLDGHAFTDEAVAGDLAVLSDSGPFLYFDERPYFGVVADFTAIEVHEVLDLYVVPKFYVRGDSFCY